MNLKHCAQHLDMWSMIIRPNIHSEDILINANSQADFLLKLQPLLRYDAMLRLEKREKVDSVDAHWTLFAINCRYV